jgi:hypothetical protein
MPNTGYKHVMGLMGSWTLSIEKNTFRELGLFPSSGEGWEMPTLLGPLERANPNHWAIYVRVRVTLRPAVSRSVRLGVEPHLGLVTRY